MRLRLPDRESIPLLAAAGTAWAGVLVEPGVTVAVIGLAALLGGTLLRRTVVVWAAVAFLAGTLAGTVHQAEIRSVIDATFPSGPATVGGVATTDVVEAWGRPTFLLEIDSIDGRPADGVARVEPASASGMAAGMRLTIRGVLRPAPGEFRGRPVTGAVSRAVIVTRGGPETLVARWGNAIRDWIRSGVRAESGRGRALLLGFLIGDTSALSRMDVGVLRRAGLSHFVAVSGSNVALFLGLWWIVLAPLTIWRRVRIPVGVCGLALFVVVTRGEPSVVRAAATAAIVLVARGVGVPVDAWRALSLAVIGAVLWDPSLGRHVGFALSVAATVGVVVGSGLFRFRPKWASTTLSASVSAQIAVTPVLIPVFGSVPLISPLANLAAAPLVAGSTAVGGIGALLHARPAVDAGAGLARLVLGIGEAAGPFPQLGPVAAGAVAVLAAGVMWRPARPAVLAIALVSATLAVAPPRQAPRPGVVFLDVGQGDAVLVLGSRLTVLVDGGPDPVLLDSVLRRWRIDRIDLVVATHVHEDHLAGLDAVIGRRRVGVLWQAFAPHETPSSRALLVSAERAQVPVVTPAPGTVVGDGSVRIAVLGPRRRYAGPNDQSIVLLVEAGETTILLPGDIETTAQRELGPIPVSMLKVPHQGAATSDPGWLTASAGRLAVVSVGPNDYGHPSDDVIEILEEAGSRVVRTDQAGDVVIRP